MPSRPSRTWPHSAGPKLRQCLMPGGGDAIDRLVLSLTQNSRMTSRRWIGVLCLIALVAIGVGVCGLEVPVPRLGGSGTSERPLQGVRTASATSLLRVGAEAPAGGELAFMAVEPSGNLLVTDRQRQSILRFDAAGHLIS